MTQHELRCTRGERTTRSVRILLPSLPALWMVCAGSFTAAAPPSAEHGRTGQTLYVSRLGDNSDGGSWATAFTTVQAALDAVPDDRGGHRIRVRPDTYMEANLHARHRGVPGAYNVLEVDFDGRLGSGRTGYAVLDASDPERGFKSVDWWSNFRAAPDFSAIEWDRWFIRHVYATGGDAGLFWDLPPKTEPFTVVVEDSVGIGRAFGGGVAHVLSRADEPTVFRRCRLWCLDWWGDAGGAYVRAENPTPPDHPDVVFDDCTLVGPDNALQAGNPGFSGHTRVKLKNSRLIVLNFSQPRGTPSTGIINSKIDGRLLHVDLEDCTLMGYKVFGAGKGDVEYTATGDVKAYVQYEQKVPEGMLRLGHWPVRLFETMLPPTPPKPQIGRTLKAEALGRDLCEVAPLVWKDRLCLLECVRPAQGGPLGAYYLTVRDVETGESLARFGEGYGLASAIVHDGSLFVFASRYDPKSGWNDVTRFESSDLRNWKQERVIRQENEHLFNSSVCAAENGFVMAYESDDGRHTPFSVKFARSEDLRTWTKIPDVVFGKHRYAACPCIRFVDGDYYLLYLEHQNPRWFFETYLARSKDLKTWQLSPANPVLIPDRNDGVNASDPDIVEFGGRTYLYYSVGDQRTWTKLRRAVYPESLGAFFASWFDHRKTERK